jgi:hypothetical protein
VARDGTDVRALALILAVAAALPAVASARDIPAAWSNYAHVHRSRSAVRLVVVHVAEGSFGGTVQWFRNPKARSSAHYVVGRLGETDHMVPDGEIAWHAGNGWVNAHSIGIEHEGYTNVDGTFTDAEYRASARLVASLLRRYKLPADRAHVIGHNQVPDPNHRGELGGFAHHTDPGTFWNWTRYMTYVRDYRAGHTPPPPPLDVTIPQLALGQPVTGVVPWTAVVAGSTAVSHVDFLVDGTVRATETSPPYALTWDSSWEPTGRHVLSVRAVGIDGSSALATVVVESHGVTPAPPVVGSIGLESGDVVDGSVELDPELSGGPVARLELWVDGAVAESEPSAPLTLDPSSLTPGPHTVAVRAVGPRGAVSATVVVVTVAPPPPLP